VTRGAAASAKNEDAQSTYSRHSKAKSVNPSTRSKVSTRPSDVERDLNALTEGKGVGMTEAQWNAIVMQNLDAHNSEKEFRKR